MIALRWYGPLITHAPRILNPRVGSIQFYYPQYEPADLVAGLMLVNFVRGQAACCRRGPTIAGGTSHIQSAFILNSMSVFIGWPPSERLTGDGASALSRYVLYCVYCLGDDVLVLVAFNYAPAGVDRPHEAEEFFTLFALLRPISDPVDNLREALQKSEHLLVVDVDCAQSKDYFVTKNLEFNQ